MKNWHTNIGVLSLVDNEFIQHKRLHNENRKPGYRTDFARDRDRIIHSKSFRRLKGKTQVFHFGFDDHVRNRLTHTLEVSQIGRSIANALYVNEELVEVICLSHDLGHPPFGHIGEDALNHCLKEYDGYNHNIQSIKSVTKIEHTYPGFVGLNLSKPVIDGMLKHDGKMSQKILNNKYIQKIVKDYDININNFGSIESQIAGMSDQIAYNHHDLDDGFRSGIITLEQFVDELEYAKKIYDNIKSNHPNINKDILTHELIRTSITNFIIDGVEHTKSIIQKNNISNISDVYGYNDWVVNLSDNMIENSKQIYDFLFKNLYRCDTLMKERDECFDYVVKLFEYYKNNYDSIEVLKETHTISDMDLSYKVADYIAGMTDVFAYNEYMEHCNE